jgi:branched-chain amino acid transport system permease protein
MEGLVSTALIGVSIGAQYAMLSIGFTMVFGIMGVVNFAHGGGYLLGGYLAFFFAHFLGAPFALAVLLAAISTGVIGYFVEVTFVDKYINDPLATMIITLGLHMIIVTGVIQLFGPEPVEFQFPVSGSLRWKGLYMSYSNIIVLFICGLAIASMYYLIFGTRYGIALRAMADNRAVATAQGILPSRMFPMAFALSMALAGLTGALMTPILVLEPGVGDSVLLKAFIVVILGGLGSVGGATIAAFGVGMVEAFSSVYLGSSRGTLLLFVVVMLILLVRPSGLMGREVRRA